MKIIVVDTSTSIGFDEAKESIIEKVNEILDDETSHVYFFNTRLDGYMYCSSIIESDFDMKGSSSVWDSIYDVIERHKDDWNVQMYILTDGDDTSSKRNTMDDVDHYIWFQELVKWWTVRWLKI